MLDLWGKSLKDDCPHQKNEVQKFTIPKKSQTLGDVAQSLLIIYAVVENLHEDHHASIIEMEGELCNQIIFIFIDPSSNYNYIILELMEKCKLAKYWHAESWLVQSRTGTKRRTIYWVKSCAFELRNMPTTTHLHFLPLGVYNMLSKMDLLYML